VNIGCTKCQGSTQRANNEPIKALQR
jgi:hypothetical protein